MQVSIVLEPVVAEFYSRIAHSSDRELQQVLEDALFCLAGELSLQAINASSIPPT